MSESEDYEILNPGEVQFGPIDWSIVTPEELSRRASVFSFTANKAKERLLKVERWIALITTHIYIDHILSQLLSENLRKPDALMNDRRRKYYVLEKLEISEAMGWLGEPYSPIIRKVNSVRNNLAHNLIFELPPQLERDLIRMMTPEMTQITKETFKPKDTQSEPELGDHLLTFLVFLDIARQSVLRLNYMSRHRDRELAKAMVNAREVLAKWQLDDDRNVVTSPAMLPRKNTEK